MPQENNSEKPDLGDWTDWAANGITALFLGSVIGILFGWQFKGAGIFWGCAIWTLVFAIIGFRKQIWYFLRFICRHVFNKQQSRKGD